MTRLIIAALLGFLLSTDMALASDERPRILAFGDSLTAGYNLPEGLGYAPQLEDALRRRGIAASVVDGGVSGDTSSAGRARLGWTLDGLDEQPDLLVIALGGNDVLRAIDPAVTEENLSAMIETAKERGIAVLLIGMRAPPNYDPHYVRHFDAIYPALAKRYGVPLYPFFLDGVIGEPGRMQADGLHPTFEGVKQMVTRTADRVIDAL
ncbi:arylesterase [Sphingomicrobium lutaoense]|uniref:Acyl-CoA thioesterase-1 n=1 Tax=Sphingomicrobium lutaoense TaxID=515949 RepID=A0A839Z5P5_9SPHN|nr:arylesterase [Sphingomicrobium lutaoense]MBB3764995.1 acyl-CoA thioesterase-1 [Sphingomicrobium lutaoense]